MAGGSGFGLAQVKTRCACTPEWRIRSVCNCIRQINRRDEQQGWPVLAQL
jgi:hypothetical protein